MTSIDARRETIAKATRMNAERRDLAAEYVAGLTDVELAVQWRKHMPSGEKARKKNPLTGRESAAEFLALPPPRRTNLLLFQRRVWEAAKKPGRSEELIAWENYE